MPGTAFIIAEVAGQYFLATAERSDSSDRSDCARVAAADEADDWVAVDGGV
jgi:hypothetical protein